MRDARLLDLKVLHRRGEGLLRPVAVGLEVVDQLQIHPARDPVPVEIVDDDVLLHDALIVAAPGEEGDLVVSAPGAELLQRLREAHALGETVAVEAGELLHLVVHALEVDRLHVELEFLSGAEVLIQLHRADLDDLAAQVDRQLVEHGGLGAHRLIPLQIHHDIMHIESNPFKTSLLYRNFLAVSTCRGHHPVL